MSAEAVTQWNATVPIGTPVCYWTGFRDGPLAREPRRSRTRTAAQLLSGHTPVVWVEGESSCIALTHVQPLESGESG